MVDRTLISLTRAHTILDEVEDQIRKAYPGCELIIHPDPVGFAERRDQFGRGASGAAQTIRATDTSA